MIYRRNSNTYSNILTVKTINSINTVIRTSLMMSNSIEILKILINASAFIDILDCVEKTALILRLKVNSNYEDAVIELMYTNTI